MEDKKIQDDAEENCGRRLNFFLENAEKMLNIILTIFIASAIIYFISSMFYTFSFGTFLKVCSITAIIVACGLAVNQIGKLICRLIKEMKP